MAEESKQENKPITLKKLKFLVGSFVYLKTDPYQHKRIVIAIHLSSAGYQYEVRLSDNDSSVHFDIELSDTAEDIVALDSLDDEGD